MNITWSYYHPDFNPETDAAAIEDDSHPDDYVPDQTEAIAHAYEEFEHFWRAAYEEAFEDREDEQAIYIRDYVEEVTGKPAYTPALVDQRMAWLNGYGDEPIFASMLDCDTRGPTQYDMAHENSVLRDEALS